MQMIPDPSDSLDEPKRAVLSLLRESVRSGSTNAVRTIEPYFKNAEIDLEMVYPINHRMCDISIAMEAAAHGFANSTGEARGHYLEDIAYQIMKVLDGMERDEHGYTVWHHAAYNDDAINLLSDDDFLSDILDSDRRQKAWHDANNASGLPAPMLTFSYGIGYLAERSNYTPASLYEAYIYHHGGLDVATEITGRTVWEQLICLHPQAAAEILEHSDRLDLSAQDPVSALKHAQNDEDNATGRISLHEVVAGLMNKHPSCLVGHEDLAISIISDRLGNQALSCEWRTELSKHLHTLQVQSDASTHARFGDDEAPVFSL